MSDQDLVVEGRAAQAKGAAAWSLWRAANCAGLLDELERLETGTQEIVDSRLDSEVSTATAALQEELLAARARIAVLAHAFEDCDDILGIEYGYRYEPGGIVHRFTGYSDELPARIAEIREEQGQRGRALAEGMSRPIPAWSPIPLGDIAEAVRDE